MLAFAAFTARANHIPLGPGWGAQGIRLLMCERGKRPFPKFCVLTDSGGGG